MSASARWSEEQNDGVEYYEGENQLYKERYEAIEKKKGEKE